VANKEDTDKDSKADCDIPVITPQKRKQGLIQLTQLPHACTSYQKPKVIEEVPIGNLHQAQKLSLISASSAIKKAS
jgi:hypothetical protein